MEKIEKMYRPYGQVGVFWVSHAQRIGRIAHGEFIKNTSCTATDAAEKILRESSLAINARRLIKGDKKPGYLYRD